ncbi:MAG: hypothetical protein QXI19_09980 [Candidatus Caldarchaeum sp.]
MRRIILLAAFLSTFGLAVAFSAPSFAQEVVILYCAPVLGSVKVTSISPSGAFWVSPGEGCADALADIINEGFSIEERNTTNLGQTVYTLKLTTIW